MQSRSRNKRYDAFRLLSSYMFLLEDIVVYQNVLYSHDGSLILPHVDDMSVFFQKSGKSLQN